MKRESGFFLLPFSSFRDGGFGSEGFLDAGDGVFDAEGFQHLVGDIVVFKVGEDESPPHFRRNLGDGFVDFAADDDDGLSLTPKFRQYAKI
ncbi:MAG: hypothetical protein PHQ42_01105 [Patescibacteria group bacterium]|nr:hypothetical protein [Patescibacteria group bacterium]